MNSKKISLIIALLVPSMVFVLIWSQGVRHVMGNQFYSKILNSKGHSLIIGTYFILSGLCRFVEESFRGEPQTWIIAGLKIYQWMAAASLLTGAIITMIPSATTPDHAFWIDWKVITAALLFGILSTFAMGADFPNSTRRFARLAPP